MSESIVSPLIEAVSLSDLHAILRSSLGEGVVVVESRQIGGGLFNTSYYVETRHPDYKLIVRVAPPKDTFHTLFEYEKTMMACEPAVYEIMRENGIPVPEVVALDTSGEIVGRDVILLRYLDSVQMNDARIGDDAKEALQRQLGAMMRQMHSITSNQFGRVAPDGTVIGDGSWQAVSGGLFEEAIQLCRRDNLLDPEMLDKAQAYFEAHAEFLDDDSIRPALVHGDMWDANVLVKQDDDGWDIVAIIDVDRAMFADSEFEGALWYNTAAFHEGYGKPLDASHAGQIRRKLYHLYSDLFHVFVFGIQIPVPDYLARHRSNIYGLLG